MLSPKGSQLSPRLLSLLNTFEEAFAARLQKLNPKDKGGVLSLTWMKLAMESLCETHTAIKTLITELELPVTEWDAKWIDVYLDITVKLLDICIAFSSEISRLSQDSLVDSLTLPKVKNSAKVDSENLLDLDVPSTISWAQAYSDLQTTVNGEIRDKWKHSSVPFSDLGGRAEKLSQVLDVLAKEVDGFFKIVLSGRDALLCNLRVSDTVADPFSGNSGEQVRG
ncbi:BPS1-LIKE PROTEIN [Salix purpurea]|uniref:BPS1-LIKE PROTEIN n=1 Tax=Salix purpurea TaxID=77065 RepID=A0A9Q0SK29_SALPP|nr:BPS1-LIKE PROTEIN [Salix purpurea]